MSNVNNRYREYRVTVPAATAAQIKQAAQNEKMTETELLNYLLALGTQTLMLNQQASGPSGLSVPGASESASAAEPIES